MKIKSTISIMLVLVLLACAFPLTVHADSTLIAEGNDGAIHWRVDSVTELGGDRRLTIEPRTKGTSVRMPDYALNDEYFSTAPWADDRNLMYKDLKEIVIADGITYIGSYAFVPKGGGSVYSYLKYAYHFSLSMADSVTEVGEGAFAKMGLDSIRWSSSLKKIGKNAFYLNEYLPSINLPDSVEEIGEAAFWLCRGAESVSFGSAVTQIADDMFERCESLSAVYYNGTPQQFNQIAVGKNNEDFTGARVYVPLSGSVSTSVSQGVAVGKRLTSNRTGFAGTLNAVSYRWERSADKQNWTTVGKSNFYTIQEDDSEQYLRVSIYSGTITVGGRTFYTDGTLFSSAIKMPAFAVCSVSGVLNIPKGVSTAITYQLYDGKDQLAQSGFVQDDSANKCYAITGLTKGSYTLKFTPASTYVPRTYAVTVEGSETLDIELYKYGDVDGDGEVTNFDYGRINSHAKGKTTLTGYQFLCADIDGDGEITNFDAGIANSHAKGKSSLWT